MTFIIDLLDGSDTVIGDGPLNNVLSVSIGESLDQAGQIQFTLPATDYRAATLLDQAVKFRVQFDDGTLVYGVLGGDTIDATADQPTRVVQGFDLLAELGGKSIGWWCYYEASDINTVILPDLLAGTGWTTGTIEAGLGNFTQRFDGDSRLAALIKLTQQLNGKHFRRGSGLRVLDFGSFGTLAASEAINVHHVLHGQAANAAIMIIGSLQLTSDRAAVVHRIYPWGAGNDNGDTNRFKASLWYLPFADSRWSEIGITYGVRGAATSVTAVGADGHEYQTADTSGFMEWPIQQLAWVTDPDDLTQPFGYNFVVDTIDTDAALWVRGSPLLPGAPGNPIPAPTTFPVTVYGNPQLYLQTADYDPAAPREAVIIFNDVKAFSSSASDLAAIAPQLFERAKRYLLTHAVPQRSYAMTVVNAPYTLRVGDKLRVRYRGAVTRRGVTVDWIDVDEELYLINITRTTNSDGTTNAVLEVSNIDAQPLDDVGALADGSSQVSAMAVNAS